jgi:hypothetical protein
MDDCGEDDTNAFAGDIFDSDMEESSYFPQHEPSTSFRSRRGGFQV